MAGEEYEIDPLLVDQAVANWANFEPPPPASIPNPAGVSLKQPELVPFKGRLPAGAYYSHNTHRSPMNQNQLLRKILSEGLAVKGGEKGSFRTTAHKYRVTPAMSRKYAGADLIRRMHHAKDMIPQGEINPAQQKPGRGSSIKSSNILLEGENLMKGQKAAGSRYKQTGTTAKYAGRGNRQATGLLKPGTIKAVTPPYSTTPMMKPGVFTGRGPALLRAGGGLGMMLMLPNTQIEPSGDPGIRTLVPQKPTKWYHYIFGPPRKEVFVDRFGNPWEG